MIPIVVVAVIVVVVVVLKVLVMIEDKVVRVEAELVDTPVTVRVV